MIASTPEYDREKVEELIPDISSLPYDSEEMHCVRDRRVRNLKEVFEEIVEGRSLLLGSHAKLPRGTELRAELVSAARELRADLVAGRAQLEEQVDGHLFPQFRASLLRLYRQRKGILIVIEAAHTRADMEWKSALFRECGIREYEAGPQ